VSTLDVGRQAILEAISPMACIMGGTGAMYVMGKLPDKMNDQEAARKLVKEYGVAVIPGSFCGFPGKNLVLDIVRFTGYLPITLGSQRFLSFHSSP
jgi:aspartate/methionine/tyrosine aminotransferase